MIQGQMSSSEVMRGGVGVGTARQGIASSHVKRNPSLLLVLAEGETLPIVFCLSVCHWVHSIKDFLAKSEEHMYKLADSLLDAMTNGEHSKTIEEVVSTQSLPSDTFSWLYCTLLAVLFLRFAAKHPFRKRQWSLLERIMVQSNCKMFYSIVYLMMLACLLDCSRWRGTREDFRGQG